VLALLAQDFTRGEMDASAVGRHCIQVETVTDCRVGPVVSGHNRVSIYYASFSYDYAINALFTECTCRWLNP